MSKLKSIRMSKGLVALAVTNALFVTNVAASEDENYSGVERIIVTAQKRQQIASEVPVAIDVLGAKELANKSIQDFSSLSSATPSLQVSRGNSTGNPIITVRGVGSTDPWVNNNPSVSAFTDGIYLPFSSYLSMPLFDLERIEILKGPQAGLYGRNSIAGAINFVSAKPAEEKLVHVEAKIGTYGAQQYQGVVNGAITEKFMVRVAGITEQGGGYMTRPTNDGGQAGFTRAPGTIPGIETYDKQEDYGDVDKSAIRLSALWLASDDIQANFKVHYGEDQSEIIGSTSLGSDILKQFTPPNDAAHVDYDNFRGKMDASNVGYSLQVDWEIEDLTFSSVTGYERLTREYGAGDFVPLRIAEPTYDEEVRSLMQEFRLAYETDDMFVITGVNFTDDKINYMRNLSSIDLLKGELLSQYEQNDESWSAFVQADYTLTDDLVLSGGLRYTDESKDYDGGSEEGDPYGTSIVALFYPDVAGGLYDQVEYENDDVSGQLKLAYTGVDGIMVYGSVSTGFKSGGFDGSGIVNAAGFIPYGAEKLNAFEVGIKSSWLEDTLRFDMSSFAYDYQDKQVIAILDLGNGLTEAVTQNAAESDVFGVDFDTTYRLTESLTLGFAGTVLDSEITDWDSADPDETAARLGNELPSTPQNSFSASIDWKSQFMGNELQVLLWAVKNDSTFRDIENTEELKSDSYTLVNARINLTSSDQDWSVYLYGNNLTDKEYITSVRTLVGMKGAYYGAPRTAGIGMTYNF